jgi:hypothetical protein
MARMIKNVRRRNKPRSKKVTSPEPLGEFRNWIVQSGELKRSQGRPSSERLFLAVAEKIPKEALSDVRKDLKDRLEARFFGVYVAHDSMGYPRYIGRGDIYWRLTSRFKKNADELSYFSFYVVKEKVHEREIETLLIRTVGDLLDFNAKKKRTSLLTGSVKDFEAGTIFYLRKPKRKKRE